MTTERKAVQLSHGIAVLSVVLGLGLFAGCCGAAGVAISSSPNGSAVDLTGQIRVAGVTPFEFPGGLGGHFRVEVQKLGFESRVGWLDFTPQASGSRPTVRSTGSGPEVITTLAGLAGPSKFVRGETEKGIILSVAQAAALLGAVSEEYRSSRYRDKCEEFERKYASAGSEEAAATYHTKVWRNYEFYKSARFARNDYLIAAAVPSVFGFVENFLMDHGSGLVGSGANGVSFRLKPVTKSSAVLRGILFPGMGHVYAGHRLAGSFWSASVLSAVGATLIAQEYCRDCEVRYSEALLKYQAAGTEEAALTARQEVKDKFQTLDDASLAKRSLRGLTIGLWALSILDAARTCGIAPEQSGSRPGNSLSMDVFGYRGSVYVGVKVPIGKYMDGGA